MATMTSHPHLYGKLVRRTYIVDGIHYSIARSDLQSGRWELRRYLTDAHHGPSIIDAFVILRGTQDNLETAQSRLLGK